MGATRLIVILAAGLGLAAGLAWLADAFPGSLDDGDAKADLIYAGILVAVLAAALASRRDARLGALVKAAAAWGAIALALLLAYSFRGPLEEIGIRLMGDLVPGRPQAAADGSVTLAAGRDGHFHVRAQVEGKTVAFLVDTGASDVMLSKADARRIGLDPDKLRYSKTYQTANGPSPGAPVTLRELAIGPIRLTGVRASVAGGDLAGSLLGMSFLSRLGGFSIEDGRLTLRP